MWCCDTITLSYIVVKLLRGEATTPPLVEPPHILVVVCKPIHIMEYTGEPLLCDKTVHTMCPPPPPPTHNTALQYV